MRHPTSTPGVTHQPPPISGVAVVRMTAEMVPAVADLHFEAFAGFMNTRIGRRYVRSFINWFRGQEAAIALAAVADGAVVGYTVGAPLGYQQWMNRDLAAVAAGGMIIRPWVLLDASFRHAVGERLGILLGRKPADLAKPELPPPTLSLVGIGVSPKLSGRRVGDRLMEAFEAEARERGMKSLMLSVLANNAPARRLYERRGWSPCPCPGKDVMYYALVFSAASAQPATRTGSSPSIAEYAVERARSGTRTLPGTCGTFWIGHESGTMMRMPMFHAAPPAPGEVRQVLRQGRAAVVSYILEADEQHPVNAWLYVCPDRAYELGKLPPSMRRNVRRGFRELRISPVAPDELLAHGAPAFCDTRRRVGLSDGTPEEFRRRFRLRARCRGHVFLGAWKEDQLAAFLSIIEVDDWAEIEGCFSMDAWLQLRPNDALLYSALFRYLVEGGCRLVCYGLSSIQAESNAAGLHAFKTKVGFKAQPVYRAFVLHPLLRPFAHPLTRWSLNALLRFKLGERHLKKSEGILAYLLGEQRMPEAAARHTSDGGGPEWR